MFKYSLASVRQHEKKIDECLSVLLRGIGEAKGRADLGQWHEYNL
jgi:hypothetical protein